MEAAAALARLITRDGRDISSLRPRTASTDQLADRLLRLRFADGRAFECPKDVPFVMQYLTFDRAQRIDFAQRFLAIRVDPAPYVAIQRYTECGVARVLESYAIDTDMSHITRMSPVSDDERLNSFVFISNRGRVLVVIVRFLYTDFAVDVASFADGLGSGEQLPIRNALLRGIKWTDSFSANIRHAMQVMHTLLNGERDRYDFDTDGGQLGVTQLITECITLWYDRIEAINVTEADECELTMDWRTVGQETYMRLEALHRAKSAYAGEAARFEEEDGQVVPYDRIRTRFPRKSHLYLVSRGGTRLCLLQRMIDIVLTADVQPATRIRRISVMPVPADLI